MQELFAASPMVFAGAVFAFALLIGSFLNVVIHRLPIMMQREWRDQCEELQEALPDDLPEGSFNLAGISDPVVDALIEKRAPKFTGE